MGYLSRYFLRYFDVLDPDRHYLIAPQAPSKYYLNSEFKHVGASWLTRENTSEGMENILSYLDALMAEIKIPEKVKFVVFGYSQGVSIATRWVSRRKVKCDHLILYSGGIPDELRAEDMSFLDAKTRIKIIVGNKDQYITPERLEVEKKKAQTLFEGKAEIEIFEGGHEIKKEIIRNLP